MLVPYKSYIQNYFKDVVNLGKKGSGIGFLCSLAISFFLSPVNHAAFHFQLLKYFFLLLIFLCSYYLIVILTLIHKINIIKDMRLVSFIVILTLPFVLLYSEISTVPFNSPYYMTESERFMINLEQHFQGKNLSYNITTSSPAAFRLSASFYEKSSCSKFGNFLQKNTIIAFQAYANTSMFYDLAALAAVTSSGDVYVIYFKINNKAECEVIKTNSKKLLTFNSLSQVEDKIVYIGTNKDKVNKYYFNPFQLKNLTNVEQRMEIKKKAIPLDMNKLLTLNGKRLEIVIPAKEGDEPRTIYINMEEYNNDAVKIITIHSKVITLEENKSSIRMFTYESYYEDLNLISEFKVPHKVNEIYVSLYEQNTLLILDYGTDTIFMYNIEDFYFPRLIRIFDDKDFVIKSTLKSTERMASSADYIGVLCGSEENLQLKVLGKLKVDKNNVFKIINVGKNAKNPRIFTLDYYNNTFIVVYDKGHEIYHFFDPLLIITCDNNKTDTLTTKVTAYRNNISKSLDLIVHTNHKEGIISKNWKGSWLGYEFHWIDVDLEKYYIGNAVQYKSHTGDNLTVKVEDKLTFINKTKSNNSLFIAKAQGYNRSIMILSASSETHGLLVKMSSYDLRNNEIKSTISLFSLNKCDRLTFADDLDELFLVKRVKEDPLCSYCLRLYHVDFKGGPVRLLSDREFNKNEDYLVNSLMYSKSEATVTVVLNYTNGNINKFKMMKYKFDCNSLNDLLSIESYVNEGHLVNYYAGSDFYSVTVVEHVNKAVYDETKREIINGIWITFYSPYFRNFQPRSKEYFPDKTYKASYFGERYGVVLTIKSIFVWHFLSNLGVTSTLKKEYTIPHEYNTMGCSSKPHFVGVIEKHYFALVVEHSGTHHILVYDLTRDYTSSLYAHINTNISCTTSVEQLHMLSTNKHSEFYILLNTNKEMYTYLFRGYHKLKVRVNKKHCNQSNCSKKFNVSLESMNEAKEDFTVELLLIPQNSTCEVLEKSMIVRSHYINLTQYIKGYSLNFELEDSRDNDVILYAEYKHRSKSKIPNFIVLPMTNVKTAMGFHNHQIIYITNQNTVHTNNSDHDFLPIEKDIKQLDLRANYLYNLNNSNTHFVVYNRILVLEEDTSNFSLIYKWGKGTKDNEDKGFSFTQLNFDFTNTYLEHFTIGKVLNIGNETFYFILSAKTTDNHFQFNANDYIAVGNCNGAECKIEHVLNRNDFVDFINSFHIIDSVIIKPDTILILIENQGIYSLQYDRSKKSFKITYIDVTKGNDFTLDRPIVKIFLDNYYYGKNTLYALHSDKGFFYATNFSVESYNFILVPVTVSEYDLNNIFADDNIIIVHEGSDEGNFIHCFKIDHKNTILPKFRLNFNYYNITRVVDMWTERRMKDGSIKEEKNKALNDGLFLVYIKTIELILSFEVFLDPVFVIGSHEENKRIVKVKISSPLEEEIHDFEVIVEEHIAESKGVFVIAIMIGLLLLVIIPLIFYKKKGAKSSHEDREFVLNDSFASYHQ